MNKKIWIIIISLYILGSVVHIHSLNYSGNFKTEKVNIWIENPTNNTNLFNPYEKPIQIYFPNEIYEKCPAVILIHGDNSDYKSFNLLIRQLLSQNFAIIVQNFNFSQYIIFELNSTLNYLLNRTDIDSNNIALIGHSHGSHYAFFFSFLRSTDIKSTILINFGERLVLYDDYWRYFPHFVQNASAYLYPFYQQNYQFPINNSVPSNLLIISDRLDPGYINFENNMEHENIWGIIPNAMQIGNFESNTARRFIVKFSPFIHTTGLYDTETISIEINWLRQSFAMDLLSNLNQLKMDHNFQLAIILLNNICGILILIGLGSFISDKPELIHFKKIEHRHEIQDLFSEETYNLANYSPDFRKISLNNAILQEMLSRITFGIFVFVLITLLIHYFVNPDRAMIYVPESIYLIFEWIFIKNQELANIIFTSSLSYNFMYFWAIIILFIQAIFVSPVMKFRSRSNFQNTLNELIIMVAFLGVFAIVSYCQIVLWTGINIPNSIINTFIRFMISYIFIGIIFRYYLHCISIGNDPKVALTKATLLYIFLYVPSLFPKLDSSFVFYIYFIFFFIPFIMVIIISLIMLHKKKSILLIAVLSFLILLIKDMLFAFIMPIL